MKTDESACFKGDDDNENEDELLCYGDSDYNNILGVLYVDWCYLYCLSHMVC
jgi:hypothetical protein